MPPRGALLAIAAGDRWLLAFALATLSVLAAGGFARRVARIHRGRARRDPSRVPPSVRRRAGVLIAAGPMVGFLTSPTLGEHALLAALGAVALAAAATAVERRPDADRFVAALVVAAAAIAVAFGVRFGPTGVSAVDVLGAVALIATVTFAIDGLGTGDGLAPGLGAAGALGVFALAGFAGQDSLAAVAVGLLGACTAFLAFSLPPASLFVGRGGRLAIGYTLAVGALAVRLPVGSTGRLLVPLVLLGLFVLDAVVVFGDRLRRQRALVESRADHIVHRLVARGWSKIGALVALVVAQLVLTVTAVFTGRGVLALWLGIAITAAVLATVGGETARGQLDREPPRGLGRRARMTAGFVAIATLLAVLPTVLVVPDVRDAMDRGREAASSALAAARDGDELEAELGFRQASAAFEEAHDRLGGWSISGALAVPGLASNLRAARTLADVGLELARAGERLTFAVDPASLEVIDGRLPLEEVRRVTPALEDGAVTLEEAVVRLRAIDQPYLIPAITEALGELTSELSQATGEARRGAAAALLAPAIFGADGARNYLLVVQNNAELRATGGLIGNWGLITAVDGDVSVGELLEPAEWNAALRAVPDPTLDVPPEYLERYGFRPEWSMQDANLTQDFPTVTSLLTGLAPQVGLPPIDGVLAVDPLGLAALLELTGPVRVSGWPEDITADNVVEVTLRDAYAAFADESERTEFIGNVAETVVDGATSVNLGEPARIARVLGGAAHEGHLIFGFTDPEEEELAKTLDVAGELAPVRSDALAVNTQNAAANKIDYYLDRRLEYRVDLEPDADGETARIDAELTLRLENTAPAAGLPEIVIGPFSEDYAAGQNRSLVSVYSPLDLRAATVDGEAVHVAGAPEAGRSVYGLFVDIPAESTRTLEMRFTGRVPLEPGGWYELALDPQPTLEPDPVHVSVEVPDGWEVVEAPGLLRPFDRRASGAAVLARPRRVRVQVAPDPPALSLWDRLRAGT